MNRRQRKILARELRSTQRPASSSRTVTFVGWFPFLLIVVPWLVGVGVIVSAVGHLLF